MVGKKKTSEKGNIMEMIRNASEDFGKYARLAR